ncbi:MAG: hypothetical protein QXQ70_01770 [Candidatus Caldarchaeum sp.]
MKRHRFVCSECGAEYWLQAWKAVCPSCQAEFTLEQRPEERSKQHARGNMFTLLAMSGYVLFSLLAPGGISVYSIVPWAPIPVLQALTLVLALLSYAGSEPALWLSAVFGASAVLFHVFNPSAFSIIGIAVGATVVIASVSFIQNVRRLRRHDSTEADARTMPEYSGWAGSQEPG